MSEWTISLKWMKSPTTTTSVELTHSACPNAIFLLRPIHERAATAHFHAPRSAKTLLHSGHTLNVRNKLIWKCQKISSTGRPTGLFKAWSMRKFLLIQLGLSASGVRKWKSLRSHFSPILTLICTTRNYKNWSDIKPCVWIDLAIIRRSSYSLLHANRYIFVQMGTFLCKWVHFWANGYIFVQMGTFSCKWVRFCANGYIFVQMGTFLCK